MNTPSTLGENWKWRLKKDEITEDLLKEILEITRLYGRYHKKTKVLLTVDSEAEDSQIQDAEMNNAQNSQQNAVSENTIKSSV